MLLDSSALREHHPGAATVLPAVMSNLRRATNSLIASVTVAQRGQMEGPAMNVSQVHTRRLLALAQHASYVMREHTQIRRAPPCAYPARPFRSHSQAALPRQTADVSQDIRGQKEDPALFATLALSKMPWEVLSVCHAQWGHTLMSTHLLHAVRVLSTLFQRQAATKRQTVCARPASRVRAGVSCVCPVLQAVSKRSLGHHLASNAIQTVTTPWRAVIFPPRAKCALTSVPRRREVVRSKHVLALLAMKERNGSLLWVCVQHVSLESINQSQGLPLVSVAQEENIPNQMQHHAVSALLVHIHFCYLRRRKTIALVAPQGSTLVRNSQKSVSTANVSACGWKCHMD